MRLLVAAALLTTPAIAQTPGAAPAAAPSTAEKKVCRQGETPTGSVMAARRTCHTPTEWAAIDANGKAARDEAQRQLDNRGTGAQSH